MTAPIRQPMDWLVGVVQPAAAAATVMTSPLFATLPTYWSPSRYLPMEIVDENTGKYESIRVVGTDGSSTATVVRGVEGTDPQTWDQPSTIRCSPAVRDVLTVVTAYGQENFADLPIGTRYIVATQRVVREKTGLQGGLPAVRADPQDFFADISTPLTVSDWQRVPRIKAFPIGPLVTPSTGLVEIIFNGVLPNIGGPFSYWAIATDANPLTVLSSVQFTGILSGSDPSWAGQAAIAAVYIPGEQRITLKFLTPSGAPLANKQARGSLALFGK